MLTNLTLRNIKCFDYLDIKISGLNILTGINGVGKSTVIQSALLIAQSENGSSANLNGPLIEIGDYSDLLHKNAEDDAASISISHENDEYQWGFPVGYDLATKKEYKNKFNIASLPKMVNGDDQHKIFNNFQYISAERWGPRNNVPLNTGQYHDFWLGKHGEFTIPVLEKLSSRLTLPQENTDSKAADDKLSTEDPRRHYLQNSELILDHIISWMGEISPNVSIDAKKIREAATAYCTFSFADSSEYKATNVGFGLSYSLSIVTALLISKKDSVVLLENPEAHLHPRGQSQMGKLMALAAKAGVQIIVETHSEHVINGARILVRKDIISPEEMNILYFQRDNEAQKSSALKLELNEMGQILEWPEGFFDQHAIDLRTLMSGV